MKQIQTFFTLFGNNLVLDSLLQEGTYFYLPEPGQWPTYLVCRGFKTCLGPLKTQQGSPRQAIQGQNQLPIQKKLGLGCVYTCTVQVWPLLLQILDKNRPKSSQNLTPILWLVLTTTHYQEQLLQNQGEFMVKKGPLESEKGPRGPEKGLLRS